MDKDAGYEISEQMPYEEYQEKLKQYCLNKFPEKLIPL